jgi:hypothetical protein
MTLFTQHQNRHAAVEHSLQGSRGQVIGKHSHVTGTYVLIGIVMLDSSWPL